MENKKTVIAMFICTLIFGFFLAISLAQIDPRTALWLGFTAVTAALLLFLWGLIGTLILAHRVWRKKNKPAAVALRQASFFSSLVVIGLYLQRFELLTWWNVGFLIGAVVLLEMFFVGHER